MTNNQGLIALELAKSLENFVQQQSLIIGKMVGVQETKPAAEPVMAIHGHAISPGQQFDPILDARVSKEEESFGEEMSDEELLGIFGEIKQPEQGKKYKPLKEMTLEEIKSWEKDQENSTDLYKIKARVANLARETGGQLTAQGEMLCNSYVHVMKSFYDFAETVQDPQIKLALIKLIRNNEDMPGIVIAAAGAGVREKKK